MASTNAVSGRTDKIFKSCVIFDTCGFIIVRTEVIDCWIASLVIKSVSRTTILTTLWKASSNGEPGLKAMNAFLCVFQKSTMNFLNYSSEEELGWEVLLHLTFSLDQTKSNYIRFLCPWQTILLVKNWPQLNDFVFQLVRERHQNVRTN